MVGRRDGREATRDELEEERKKRRGHPEKTSRETPTKERPIE